MGGTGDAANRRPELTTRLVALLTVGSRKLRTDQAVQSAAVSAEGAAGDVVVRTCQV